jgi:hypothetical protein
VRRLRVRKIAKNEIVTAFEWYFERSPGAARQFLDAVDEAMSVIEESPERHPVIDYILCRSAAYLLNR